MTDVPDPTLDLRHGTIFQFNVEDQFTPTPQQAGLLPASLTDANGHSAWGKTPLEYVIWFNTIWHTGDPSQWGPEVFTRDSVMIDSTGTSTGGAYAASDFLLLFKYFPSLRGEVVSWAHNDREIMINWRFVVCKGRVVPVIDKFCFVEGLVSFRVAYFDTVTFLAYLAENHGSAPLVDYFLDRWRITESRGGLLYLPGLIGALIRGLFTWSDVPPFAPTGLTARSGDRGVRLQWNPVRAARSYTVKRSTVSGGPYGWLDSKVTETSYLDRKAEAGTRYFYVVSTNAHSEDDD